MTPHRLNSRSIKHKLDGPPSKVRVQDPSQKTFVLLQASIGQIDLHDNTLRQEMNVMVEYSSRMLAAVEEHSIRKSKNGQVAVHSLALRRSLATSLWNEQCGALNQLMGVGPTTAANLKFSGMTTFDHVLAATEEEIEKVAKRGKPFGANLRLAAARILQSSSKISAHLEYVQGSTTPCSLVCTMKPRQGASQSTAGSVSRAPDVTYTLIAYTDRPGGCLIYKKDISKRLKLKVDTPPKFGKITVVLIASLVGLDGK